MLQDRENASCEILEESMKNIAVIFGRRVSGELIRRRKAPLVSGTMCSS
jgi:hypothetical protein